MAVKKGEKYPVAKFDIAFKLADATTVKPKIVNDKKGKESVLITVIIYLKLSKVSKVHENIYHLLETQVNHLLKEV